MPNPAFNKGGWFRIKQHRFNVENHPALACTEETRKTSLRLPFNEKSAIDGLARMLSTSRSEAIRIALYEYPRVVGAESPKAPHRRTRCTHSVVYQIDPDTERTVKFLAKKWGISSSEVVRTCCTGLVKGIRRGDVTKLTNSKKRSQAELAAEWSKKNKDRPKGSKLTALTEAFEARGDEMRELYQEEKDRRTQFLNAEPWARAAFTDDLGSVDPRAVDEYLDRMETADSEARFEELLRSPDKDTAVPALAELMWESTAMDEPVSAFLAQAEEEWNEAQYLRGNTALEDEINTEGMDLSDMETWGM